MKPAENQTRDIPEMGNSFDMILFKREVADLLRQNNPQEMDGYVSRISSNFPEERGFIQAESSRLSRQRMALLGIDLSTPLSGPDVRCFS
jgi:hypothetical protein